MPFYADSATFYTVMADLFDQVIDQPAQLKPLRESRIVLRITVTEPDAILLLDTRVDPPRFTTGQQTQGRADVGLHLAADTLHQVWLSTIRLRDAYAAGKVRLEGNPLRALGLLLNVIELFRYVEQLYPQVLRRRGLWP